MVAWKYFAILGFTSGINAGFGKYCVEVSEHIANLYAVGKILRGGERTVYPASKPCTAGRELNEYL